MGSVLTRSEIGEARWNAFVDAHPGGWWFHRWEWLAYQVARKQSEELSFGIMEQESLVAICPLFLEERDGVRSFTMEGHPGPWPLQNGGNIAWTASAALDIVMRLARKYQVGRAALRLHAFQPMQIIGERECYSMCDQELWPESSWHTQVLDLTQSEAELYSGLRHSYRSLINKASRESEIIVDREGELIPAFRLPSATSSATSPRSSSSKRR